MASFFPSYSALNLAEQILDTVGDRIPGYQGRIGTQWYWRLSGGILVTVSLDYSITQQRWDVIRAQAVTPTVGAFNSADFPFAVYGTLTDSPPFIHDLDGDANWSNRLYFQMGHLVDDMVLWMETLLASVLDPQIRPPSAFPALTPLECDMVQYAIQSTQGEFIIKALHDKFGDRISRASLSRLAKRWEDIGLLTDRPRRVTIALRALVHHAYTEES
jgi:hypothetical protein